MQATKALDRYPCLVFDFDGTLADTLPYITRTARQVLRDRGMSDDQIGDLRRIVGPPFPQAFSLVYGVSDQEAREITRRYREIYHELGAEGWPPFEGIRDLLRDLHEAGRKVCVASSKRDPLLRRSLGDGGLAPYVDAIQGKPDDTGAQTKADFIRTVVAEVGLSCQDALMVGDRHFDIEAAAACGMPCVGVLYGKTAAEEELVDAGACALAHTVAELHEILLGKEGR